MPRSYVKEAEQSINQICLQTKLKPCFALNYTKLKKIMDWKTAKR